MNNSKLFTYNDFEIMEHMILVQGERKINENGNSICVYDSGILTIISEHLDCMKEMKVFSFDPNLGNHKWIACKITNCETEEYKIIINEELSEKQCLDWLKILHYEYKKY